MSKKSKRQQHQPVCVTVTGGRVFLEHQHDTNPGGYAEHCSFAVVYRRITREYRPPLPLTVHAARRKKDEGLGVVRLSAPRNDLTENDLRELSCLRFYLSPGGNPNPKSRKVCQPAGLWLYRKGRMLVACLEGTQERWLAEWLEEARHERPDPRLYEVNGKHRTTAKYIRLSHKKKTTRWPARVDKPLQSFHPFRLKESLEPPPPPRPSGVLASAGGAGSTSRTRPQPSAEARKKPDAARLDLPERSELHRLGYRIGGLSRGKRWRILIEEAVPRLGLEKVARTIAGHRQRALSQAGGAERFAHAVAEWEHDLALLKRECYDRGRKGFAWPSTGPRR